MLNFGERPAFQRQIAGRNIRIAKGDGLRLEAEDRQTGGFSIDGNCHN